MLDLVKVAGQMQGMSEQLAKEAKQLTAKLDWAEQLWQGAIADQALRQQQHQQWRDRFIFACAEPVESLSQRYQIQPISTPHSIIATDGSQIAPSRHEIAYCYLINVGRVAIHYNSGIYPVLDSVPEVYYKPEDLYGSRQWGIATEDWMSLKRTVAEAIALAEIAVEQQQFLHKRELTKAQPPTVRLSAHAEAPHPLLTLTDGSLIHWNLEILPTEARAKILPDILASWDVLRQARIPLAGYISSPRAVEATNFLRLQACPFAEPDCTKHCADKLLEYAPCSRVQPLRDATLWQRLLHPGECSPLWRSHAPILQEYGEHGVYFCYLHVGVEIARVEMPAWTALDDNLRSQVLTMILAQTQKGYGYPVALSEAHNQAVVTGSDRRRFFAILEQQMLNSGLRNITISTKEVRKRGSIT